MPGRTTHPEERLDASGLRIAIVAARFNQKVTESLFDGAARCLKEHGLDAFDHVWVPGAFELPLACREVAVAPLLPGEGAAALAGAAGPRRVYDAIVALGCVIRGETPHFDYVAGEAARGLMQAQLETGVPIGFGVLTTDDEEQAWARAGGALGNKGYDAALVAIEMALLTRELR